ncbi:hypothetical protein [Modestobacter sp. SYSU DS0657]
MQTRRARPLAALLAVPAVALVGCADASATPQRPGALSAPPGLVELQPLPDQPPGVPEAMPPELLEQLTSPPVTVQVYGFIDRVRAAAGDCPDFGDVEISSDRTRLTVRWYGELPPAVQAVVDDPGDAGVEVVVEQTRFRPGELQAEAQRLITDHPDVVTATGSRPAGDGIDVTVRSSAADRHGSPERALEHAGVRSAFPLFASAGDIVPAVAG